MGGFTEVLVYAGWVVSPMIAYQGLMHGLRRAVGDFLLIFTLYAGAVAITFLTLRSEAADQGFGAISPAVVLFALLGTALMSAGLFWLGWTTDKEHD